MTQYVVILLTKETQHVVVEKTVPTFFALQSLKEVCTVYVKPQTTAMSEIAQNNAKGN